MHHFVAIGEFKLELQSGNAQFGSNWRFFYPCDLAIWRMTLKNNRAPLLCYFKLCAAFRTHWWIQTGVTVRKRPIWVKFDGWPCKTIGHLFYATSSIVHHFITIGEFKFELQPGNAQFRSKSTIFLAVWRRNFTDDPKKKKGISSMLLQALCIISYPLVDSNWSYSPETPYLGQIRRFLEPCDLEIWRMTFKNNRAPLLCYFKLCAAFHSHWWIQTGVTVRKRPIWVKFVHL